MPTYDYKCSDCGHAFEEFQSMKDPLLTRCPVCAKETLVRLISGGGVIFKGSGFYQTDYKGGSAAKSSAPAAADTPADSKVTPSATTPAPASPAPKKE